MSDKIKLNNEEIAFMSIVQKAATANPFSDKRDELDQMIIGGNHTSLSPAKILEKVISKTKSMIQSLVDKGISNINSVDDENRPYLETLVLFDFFYQFRNDFDTLIFDQMEADDKLVKLPFAGKARTYLDQWGFSDSAIQNSFEEAYQLRRAFFFIKRYIIGKSSVMKKLRLDLWNNIFTHNVNIYRMYLRNKMEDFSTLILGVTGSGKGAVAAAIGSSGYIPYDLKKQRFTESFATAFISINLSQYPESLIESELFGHKKGAFTGAVDNYNGVFKRCSLHGSIFLDEIGDISLPVQVKLLKVIQERVFTPVGSYKKERFSGRVIAATNMPIQKLRSEGVFRDDFYYRLCSDVITMPTLAERIHDDPEELKDLLDFLIKRMIGVSSPELSDMVEKVINEKLGKDYPWHGNVRELEQCVRRVILKLDYEGDTEKSPADLSSYLEQGLKRGTISAQTLMNGYCKLLYDIHGTFEEVSRRTQLDRRTVTKYIKEWNSELVPGVAKVNVP